MSETCYSKYDVYVKLKGFNQKKVREDINKIITENRNIPEFQAKREKRLRKSEYDAIMILYS